MPKWSLCVSECSFTRGAHSGATAFRRASWFTFPRPVRLTSENLLLPHINPLVLSSPSTQLTEPQVSLFFCGEGTPSKAQHHLPRRRAAR